jgi:hypothetical protein
MLLCHTPSLLDCALLRGQMIFVTIVRVLFVRLVSTAIGVGAPARTIRCAQFGRTLVQSVSFGSRQLTTYDEQRIEFSSRKVPASHISNNYICCRFRLRCDKSEVANPIPNSARQFGSGTDEIVTTPPRSEETS